MITKGKWKRGSLNDEPFARSCLSIYQEDGRRIAEVSREGFMRIEEAEANAQLIASAPDLYEALKEMLYIYDRSTNEGTVGFGTCTKARKALAKAEGGIS